MDSKELVSTIENIMDLERELKEEIDKLNVAIKCNAFLSSNSEEMRRQERILSAINIDDIERDIEIPSKILSPKELVEREKFRQELREINEKGVEIESKKLTPEELAQRENFRQELRDVNEKGVEIESKKLTPEELAQRESFREELRDVNDRGVEIESKKLSKEEMIKRETFREEIRNMNDLSVDIDSTVLTPEELEARRLEREKLVDIGLESEKEITSKEMTEEEKKAHKALSSQIKKLNSKHVEEGRKARLEAQKQQEVNNEA